MFQSESVSNKKRMTDQSIYTHMIAQLALQVERLTVNLAVLEHRLDEMERRVTSWHHSTDDTLRQLAVVRSLPPAPHGTLGPSHDPAPHAAPLV